MRPVGRPRTIDGRAGHGAHLRCLPEIDPTSGSSFSDYIDIAAEELKAHEQTEETAGTW